MFNWEEREWGCGGEWAEEIFEQKMSQTFQNTQNPNNSKEEQISRNLLLDRTLNTIIFKLVRKKKRLLRKEYKVE